MGRNLFILAATLLVLALVSCGLAYTNIAQQPGSPGDASLWRTTGLSLFEQVERRADEERRARRKP
jgi:hypothetical protein